MTLGLHLFALALNTNKTGTQILGELATSKFSGSLAVAPIIAAWVLAAALTVDGAVVAKDLLIELDSGTATVVGPLEDVKELLSKPASKASQNKSPMAPSYVALPLRQTSNSWMKLPFAEQCYVYGEHFYTTGFQHSLKCMAIR
ncbi:hypothetical protein BJ875DRAFT_498272 [Amylocarpus encephaloides]|uniref:Peptidase A1 domain-containing protein n=1 Tax=Amylocarpus encephaloides TaxID=45428 RepID=A0A9P7YE85_9HELO|nr:hypothetical protein BJ875DRAFT_498272 [Amylocarpus encephaloides]